MKNLCILIGNVGNNPEIKTIGNDNKVAKFSLATSETYKDKQGIKQTQTEWHSVVIWGGLVNVVENYIKKGSKLYIEGKIQYKSYEKDGQTKYFTEILCRNLTMLDSKSDNLEHKGIKEKEVMRGQEEDFSNEETDSLPF